MISKFIHFVLVGFIVISCGTRDKIPGTYVRNYSFKVIHPETGVSVGTRTIADTICIQKDDEGYLLTNNKWQINDFNNEGWRNMRHMEDRPMPTHLVTFNKKIRALESEEYPKLIFSVEFNSLSQEAHESQIYHRAE